MKCDECDHKRTIISENGYHYTCGLHWKSARYCMDNDYKYFSNHISKIKKNASEEEKIKLYGTIWWC